MATTRIVKGGQNIFDIALAGAGSMEAVFDLAMASGNISITDLLETGQEITIPTVLNSEVVAYYQANQIEPASTIAIDPDNVGLGNEYIENPEPIFTLE